MRLDDLQESSNIEDRRGEGGGGGGFGLPGGAGGLGIGTIIILGLIGWALGIDPSILIGGAEIFSGSGSPSVQGAPPPAQRRTGTPQDDMGRFVSRVLGSTEVVWKQVFAKDGKSYRAPVLVLYKGRTQASCGGVAQSAMGPFYCPSDQKVYLDTSFFREIENRFRGCSGKACQFSEAYVIAHEVGHHVQNLLGVLPKVQQQQQQVGKVEANHLQVRVELQADCLAGVWAYHANQERKILEPGDVEEALNAAAAVGDDRLQRQSQGTIVPDSFTHGSSAQRVRWFKTGFSRGEIGDCDTFSAKQL